MKRLSLYQTCVCFIAAKSRFIYFVYIHLPFIIQTNEEKISSYAIGLMVSYKLYLVFLCPLHISTDTTCTFLWKTWFKWLRVLNIWTFTNIYCYIIWTCCPPANVQHFFVLAHVMPHRNWYYKPCHNWIKAKYTWHLQTIVSSQLWPLLSKFIH